MLKRCFISMAFLALLATPVLASDYDLYQKSGDKSPKWDGMVKAAFGAIDSGDQQTAFVFMQKAYNLGCRDGILLIKIGLYYETNKNYAEAVKYFEEAAIKLPQQHPDYSETKKIHEHLARVYYQSNQFDRALPEIEAALKETPDNFMFLFMSGQMYRMQKRYPEAIASFEKALTAPSPRPSPARGEGTIPSPLMGEGQGGGDPRKAIYTELMVLYYEMKDYASCLKYANAILSVVPNDPAALSYRRQIQAMQYKQKEQEAIKKIIQ